MNHAIPLCYLTPYELSFFAETNEMFPTSAIQENRFENVFHEMLNFSFIEYQFILFESSVFIQSNVVIYNCKRHLPVKASFCR